MHTIDLAKRYLRIFFETQQFHQLYDIFNENLEFHGPYLNCSSAQEYIDSLKEGPWENCTYEILQEFESDTCACLIYRFKKGTKSTVMAQSFWLYQDKISKIMLIFNPDDLR